MTAYGAKVKVIETGGVPISLGLKKGDPFRREGCDFGDEGCIVDPKTSCGVMGAVYQLLCSCGEVVEGEDPGTSSTLGQNSATTPLHTPGEGNRARVVAGVRRGVAPGSRTGSVKKKKKVSKVENTRSNYLGISGRSLHARQKNHTDAVRRGDQSYPLARHMKEAHSQAGEETPKFTMRLISRHKNNLEKAMTEGILVEKQNREFLMNKKGEWGKHRGLVRITASRG
jgi:hypothetical protein